MKKLLSEEQIIKIKEEIDYKLETRCINVETKLEEIGEKLELTSTKFQTVPVIHRNLSIINFGGGIERKEDRGFSSLSRSNGKIICIWIPVSVKYDGNVEELFTVRVSVEDKKVFFEE